MAELSDAIYERIKALCEKGDALSDSKDYSEALQNYWAAWDLLPEPQIKWEAATWILGAIGDVNFHSEDFVAGCDNLSLAMHCPKAIGNPFLHLD